MELINFLEVEELPGDSSRARKIAMQAALFTLIDTIYIHPKRDHNRRVVVPQHLREQIRTFLGETSLQLTRWWEGMYSDALKFVENCPECAIATESVRPHRPPLHPIPVGRPFQIVGGDVIDLPKTSNGNKHVIVFQDYLSKWPMVYRMPDQKAERIVKLLVEEVVSFFGVPEALLSDHGTNLLST